MTTIASKNADVQLGAYTGPESGTAQDDNVKAANDLIKTDTEAIIADATNSGTQLLVTSTVVSSSIPNNTQTAGAITGAASGTLLLKEICINTNATGIVNPTNLEFSVDNVNGKTGAGSPIYLEAVAALGANATNSSKDATSTTLPMQIESGKKIYIHGDDGAGTGAGTANITFVFERISDAATIAGVAL
jgi:hypothetical protein